jgi:alkylation response protein AidB-like acyl-CoA dehydrogenase
MDFTYDEEQQALREAVRGLVGKTYSDFENRRKAVAEDPGFDENMWARLAEMGILGLPFPEEYGGMGAGAIEVGIVAQEFGRVLAPEPFLTSVVLAGGIIAAAGTEEQKSELLGALTEGSMVPTFAHAEPGSRWQPTAAGVTATQDGDSWALSGVKEPVPHGARADVLVVSAALPDGGTGLFVVPGDADGVTRTGYTTHDGGRAAKVAFDGATASPLGSPDDRAGLIARVLDIARVTACNEAVGLMEVALEQTSAYLKSRKQFGVTLNTFQALTFRAADMYVSLELARSLAVWATMVLAGASGEEASVAASRASLGVSRAGRHIGQEAIQLHGGIGMTAEYSVGHLTARLTAIDHLLGDGRQQVRNLSRRLTSYGVVEPLP